MLAFLSQYLMLPVMELSLRCRVVGNFLLLRYC